MSGPTTCENGILVDATPYSSVYSHLCLCDEGWSGASDSFDQRVARDSRNRPLALACPNSYAGSMAMWSICLVFHVIRHCFIFAALTHQFRTKGFMRPKGVANPGPLDKLRACFGYMPYRVLTLDFFLINPAMLATCIIKLASGGEAVLGTSPEMTATFSFFLSAALANYADFTVNQFKALVSSRTMSQTKGDVLLRIFKRISFGFAAIYFVFAAIPSFVMLGLDKSLGPIENHQVALLILRNVGITAWVLVQLVASMLITREAKLILFGLNSSEVAPAGGGRPVVANSTSNSGLGETGGDISGGGSGSQNSPTKKKAGGAGNSGGVGTSSQVEGARAVIAFLDRSTHAVKIQCLVFVVVYLTFCAPPLWPYQQYAFSSLTCVAIFSGNPGFILVLTSRAAKKLKTQTEDGDRRLDRQDSTGGNSGKGGGSTRGMFGTSPHSLSQSHSSFQSSHRNNNNGNTATAPSSEVAVTTVNPGEGDEV